MEKSSLGKDKNGNIIRQILFRENWDKFCKRKICRRHR
jgi:hypothetical protein